MLEDKDGDYCFSGSFVTKGWLNGVNSFGGSKKVQNMYLKFKDGTNYTWTYPMIYVGNISMGSQYQAYMDKVYIKDETNNITASLHYNPTTDNTYTGMFKRGLSFMSRKKKEKPESDKPSRGDDIIISIYKEIPNPNGDNKMELSRGSGSYLSHLILDDEVVWRITDDVP